MTRWRGWAYYINGGKTSLDSNGNGFGANGDIWEWGYYTGSSTGWNLSDNIYYVNGISTALGIEGTGYNSVDNNYYVYGG